MPARIRLLLISVLGMTSKLLILLICLTSVSFGGQKFSPKLLQDVKEFATVDSITPLSETEQRFIGTFTHEASVYYLIYEPVETKSGSICYLAVFDETLKVTAMTLPSYMNKHNATLTSRAFLRQFIRSKPASKPIRRGFKVDAISGATQSTDVLIVALNNSAEALSLLISQ